MTLVPKKQHLEAMVVLVGRQRAQFMFENLKRRDQHGFWLFREGGQVALVAIGAGSTASLLVTSPTTQGEQTELADAIRAGISHIKPKKIDLAQCVCLPNEHKKVGAFHQAGFSSLATLKYLERKQHSPKPIQKVSGADWIQMCDFTDQALGDLLKKTYIDSLDCPLIHGKRKIQDVISGHRESKHYDPLLWSILTLNEDPVGVLLLNKSQSEGYVELAYLGVVPAARGMGLGDILLHKAVQQVHSIGCDRITLAVDAQNEHALALYDRWKFREVGERHTLIRQLY